MPVAATYPGVYIEEIASGVHTLVGVATSIAAFLGRAAAGRVNEPFEVNGLGEFAREFGDISAAWPMSLAVQDFFQNGGGRAIVVRLFKAPADPGKDGDGFAHLTAGNLALRAASPGEWGEALRAAVTVYGDAEQAEMRARLGIQSTDKLFDLAVTDTRPGGAAEKHRNLTVVDSVRRLDRVLKAESRLVRWDLPATLPTVAAGTDPVAPTEQTLADAQDDLRTALHTGNPSDPTPLAEAVQKATMARQKAIDALQAGDGGMLDQAADFTGSRDQKTGLYALEKADLFNLLCIPPDTRAGTTDKTVYQKALAYCVERRALLIVDPPDDWAADTAATKLGDLGLTGPEARNAALYFPRILQSDANGELASSVPCGVIAGIMARTDGQRGVWKAPAGIDANLSGVDGLAVNLTDSENGDLNQLGINCLRTFPVTGRVVWGARTLRGANQLADEYKYIPVRRLALFLEESLYRGTKWVVFEPNDEPLWAQIRLNVGAFLQGLFRQGAFQGRSPREAYFVKCDKDTTTQNDRDLGIVNILVGFAPLKPAEFVFIKIQQLTGPIET